MVSKTLNMRLWENPEGKAWSSSVMDVGGDIMAVSQFTLYSIMKGNKPDFHAAMSADQARELFDLFVSMLRKKYVPERVQTGQFQTLMEVGSVINGPVTIQY
jgi:D-tyrosyl-tRNA(Tyr) deacylase